MADEVVTDDEDEGPMQPYKLRLPVQTIGYLKQIKRTGYYGHTVTAVMRTFIDAGIREATDKNYITRAPKD